MRPITVGLAVALSGVTLLPKHVDRILGPRPRSSTGQSLCPSVSLAPTARQSLKCGAACGRERWQVKTLSDVDQKEVDLRHPVATTVESLAALPRPRQRPQFRRVSPTETTVFCLEGWLADIPRTESDRDMHIVIAGLEDTTLTLIAEIPDARCYGACSSGFGHLYAKAYETLMDRLRTWQTDTLRIRIMGVGFYDRNHGQYGAAPNFIELHPVLAIEFP
jgi:hypothetical protein